MVPCLSKQSMTPFRPKPRGSSGAGGRRGGKGKRLDGRIGERYKSQRLTELVGGVVLRPYVPHGTKWIGEVK